MTLVRAQLGDRLGCQLARASGGSGTRPAAAGQATGSWSSGHPQTAAVSQPDTGRPDTGRGFGSGGDSGSLLFPVPQPAGYPLGGHFPAARTASPVAAVPVAPRTSSQCPQAAACATAAVGGCAWMVGSRRPRCPRSCSGPRPCRWWTAAVRPAPGRTPIRTVDTAAVDTSAVSGSADTCSVPRRIRTAGGQRRSPRSDGDAAGGHRQPQAPGAAEHRSSPIGSPSPPSVRPAV
jgi:hypothetical protein